tara:strand:+ start:275 stop:937 length:663 start_codon:yes stop_codon:yes gene_type:complete
MTTEQTWCFSTDLGSDSNADGLRLQRMRVSPEFTKEYLEKLLQEYSASDVDILLGPGIKYDRENAWRRAFEKGATNLDRSITYRKLFDTRINAINHGKWGALIKHHNSCSVRGCRAIHTIKHLDIQIEKCHYGQVVIDYWLKECTKSYATLCGINRDRSFLHIITDQTKPDFDKASQDQKEKECNVNYRDATLIHEHCLIRLQQSRERFPYDNGSSYLLT